MSKFTPGPWIYEESDMTIRTKDYKSNAGMGDYRGTIIAEIDSHQWRKVRPDSIPIKEANARLIAAAPEMYDFLKSLQCSCTVAERDSGHKAGCSMPLLKDLLAKIDGAAHE